MTHFFFGSTSSKDEIAKIIGFPPESHLIKERADLIKEILIRRAIAPITKIRKVKFYFLPMTEYERITDKYEQFMIMLKDGLNLNSVSACTVLNHKEVFNKINATYSYGKMNSETRKKYIADLDAEFADKLVNLYQSPSK